MDDARHAALQRLPTLTRGALEAAELLRRTVRFAHEWVGGDTTVVVGIEEGLIVVLAGTGDPPTWGSRRFDYARHVVAEVLATQKGQLTSDAQVTQRPDIAYSIGFQSILCVPIVVQAKSIGAFYIERRLTTGIFTADDLDILEQVALYVAGVLSR